MSDLLLLPEVLARLRIGRTQFWHLRRNGGFLAPCRMGRPLRWRADDVDRWIAEHSSG